MHPWHGFPRYRQFDPLVPVWCLTPQTPGCIHRFFDTSPVSPSGRYVALTALPAEDRPPALGEGADVVLVDLATGQTRAVARTRGFGTQLGAQVQWGATDAELYYGDVDEQTWRPVAVRLDPASGQSTRLAGPLYMVAPDGQRLAGPCLARIEMLQGGYGVTVPPTHLPLNDRFDARDGLYVTDAATGHCRLLASFRGIVEAVGGELADPPGEGAYYGFHVKWNPQGTRLMFVIRYRRAGGAAQGDFAGHLVTMDADGGNIRLALGYSAWRRGGHHPTWCPDGQGILMNLAVGDGGLRFVRFGPDGTGLETLAPARMGGGHPTLHPAGRCLLTDAYVNEPVSFGDGTTPLRWVDLADGSERTAVRIRTRPDCLGPLGLLRVDPHPAWDRSGRYVVFNACPEGVRRVYLADFQPLLG